MWTHRGGSGSESERRNLFSKLQIRPECCPSFPRVFRWLSKSQPDFPAIQTETMLSNIRLCRWDIWDSDICPTPCKIYFQFWNWISRPGNLPHQRPACNRPAMGSFLSGSLPSSKCECTTMTMKTEWYILTKIHSIKGCLQAKGRGRSNPASQRRGQVLSYKKASLTSPTFVLYMMREII